MGQDLVREELVGYYVQLLKDSEAEVRSAAATQTPGRPVVFHSPVTALRSPICVSVSRQDSPSFLRRRSF